MVSSRRFFNEVSSNNLTAGPLSVNRIIIRYRTSEISRRFRANMKYDGNKRILISIRTFAGIEAVRIMADGDSVKVNDRINRIYYRGTNTELRQKYGVNIQDIGLLLGDMDALDDVNGELACTNDQVKINDLQGGSYMEYIIDCNKHKLKNVRGSTGTGTGVIQGEFMEFTEDEGFKYPARVKWKFDKQDLEIELEIDNVSRPGNLNFIFRKEEGYIEKSIL